MFIRSTRTTSHLSSLSRGSSTAVHFGETSTAPSAQCQMHATMRRCDAMTLLRSNNRPTAKSLNAHSPSAVPSPGATPASRALPKRVFRPRPAPAQSNPIAPVGVSTPPTHSLPFSFLPFPFVLLIHLLVITTNDHPVSALNSSSTSLALRFPSTQKPPRTADLPVHIAR